MKKISPIKLAVIFHDTYERLASKFGYETKKETKLFDASSPNGKLMIEVCREMQDYILERQEAQIKGKDIQCPVCGYYCLGKGGIGCIDKPFYLTLGEIEDEKMSKKLQE